MADCGYTLVQVDHLDFNEADFIHLSKVLYDGTDNLLFCYAQQSSDVTGAAPNDVYRVYIRKYSISSGTMNTAVQVSDDNDTAPAINYSPSHPSMVMLDDGTLIVAWQGHESGADKNCKIRESTDGGATWGTITTITTGNSNETNGGLSTDGTNVWWFMEGSGSPIANDIYWWVRVSEGSWTSKGIIFDGTTTEGFWIYDDNSLNMHRAHYMGSASAGFFLADYQEASGTKRMSSFWTSDATGISPTWTKQDVHTWTTSSRSYPKIGHTNYTVGGRVRAALIEETGDQQVHLIYTDDVGQTWTSIGTPDALSGEQFDPDHWAHAIDGAGNWFVGKTFNSLPGVSNFRLWKGGDAATGWSQIVNCEVSFTPNTNPPEDMIIVGSDVYYVFGYNNDDNSDGQPEFHLALVKVPGIGDEGGDSSFNEETVNFRIYRRGVIQVERNDLPQPRNISVATIERLDKPNVVG